MADEPNTDGGQSNTDTVTDPNAEGQENTEGQQQTEEEQAAAAAANAEGEGEGGEEGGEEGEESTTEYEPLTMPEGFEIAEADQTFMTEFGSKHKLSQEALQELADYEITRVNAEAKAQDDAWKDTRKGWIDQGKADKDIGGKDFDSNVSKAAKVIDKYGTPEFKTTLDMTGAGDHPEMIRFALTIYKAVGPDVFVNPANSGSSDGGSGKTTAQKLYGSDGTGTLTTKDDD